MGGAPRGGGGARPILGASAYREETPCCEIREKHTIRTNKAVTD